jgi:hypothetical protein
VKAKAQEKHRGDELLKMSDGLLFSTQEPLVRLLRADLLPALLPALITDSIAQGEHGIDLAWCPMHARSLQAGLDDEFVGALHHPGAKRPSLPRDAQRDASNESIGFTGCLPALARRLAATFTGVQDHHDPALKTSPEPLHVRVNLVAHPVGHLDPTIRAKIAHLPQYDVAALNVDANTIMSPIGQ